MILLKLAKYFEPILFTVALIVCLYEFSRVKHIAEVRKYTKEQAKRLRILWVILSSVLLVMIVLKLI